MTPDGIHTQGAETAPSATKGSPISPIPWWIRIVVCLGALLLTAGAVIALTHPAMLASPQDEINGAVRVYAGYMASRNLALAVMLVVLLAMGARRALGNLMALVALIQFLDALIDCVERRWSIVPGVVIIGLVFLLASARLSGHPFWKRQAWIP